MKRAIWIVAIVVLLGLAVVALLRVRSGEDNRMCQNGAWIKHGNPSAEMPTIPCP